MNLYGLRTRLSDIRSKTDPANVHHDIACQFYVVKERKSGLYEVGLESKIYGGRYNYHVGHYIDDAQKVKRFPCSESQFKVVTSDAVKIEAAGGRGGGKSEAGTLRAIRCICELPNTRGRIVSPTYPLATEIWDKILMSADQNWFVPGRGGAQAHKMIMNFIHGVQVQFKSALIPKSLRSWGGEWIFFDEGQDITSRAIEIAWYGLRDAKKRPKVWTCLTPKIGEPYHRHVAAVEDKNTECIEFSSFDNPFTNKEVYELSPSKVDSDTYQIEVMASWDVIKRLMDDSVSKVVYAFDRKIHCIDEIPVANTSDITKHVTMSRYRLPFEYIGGVDFNFRTPHIVVIYKVYKAIINKVIYKKWIAIDVIEAKNNASGIAVELEANGYTPKNILLVPDASGAYSKGKKSSHAHLRDAGYHVLTHKRNPQVIDRIQAFNAKILSADNITTWQVKIPECDWLVAALESCIWGRRKDRELPSKDLVQFGERSIDPTDYFDAASYPIEMFEPIAGPGGFTGIKPGRSNKRIVNL